MATEEMENSASSNLTEDKTSCIRSDNLSGITIPSCLWLPHGPILNQGPIIKSPFAYQQENNETPEKKQTGLSHHSEMSDKSNTEDQISNYNTTDFSGFSDFVSNGAAIERERHVNDKFNGILYRVIPTFNHICIVFSSKALYSQFITALDKELHSRSSNKDNPIYQTHMQGQKCVITCNKSDCLILLTGPAMCIWRETTFLRLSFGLFKTFAAENEDKQSFQCQSSTPVEPRHVSHRTLPWSPIDFAKSISDFEQDSNCQPTMMDINRRINVLWDITKTSQTQINEINKIMCQLAEKGKNTQQKERNQNHINEDNQPKTVTINSTDDIAIVSPGTQTYHDILGTNEPVQQPQSEHVNRHQNIPSRRETNGTNSKSSKSKSRKENQNDKENRPGTSQEQSPSRTLIIGDSILSGINPKGMKNNVACQSYSGATLSTLMEKVRNL